MPKLRDMDVRAKAVEIATNALMENTFFTLAEKIGDKMWSYPTQIDIEGNGEKTEVWVVLDLTCKTWKERNVKGIMTPAFDPFEVAQEWQRSKVEKEQKAKEKEKKKRAKIKKDELARQRAKEKAKG